MSKKTIEQQVAELTPEQKDSMKKIYRKYVLSIIAIALVGIALIVGIFSYADNKEEQAKDKYDSVQATIELNEKNNTYNFDLYDESADLLEEYYDMKLLKPMSLVIGGGTAFVGVLVLFVVFKVKYPYFSEKKYTYLKKQKKSK